MAYELYAKCPCCGKEAKNDINEIERLFGFRTMANGRTIPQSYCRNCRSKRCEKNNPKCR